MHTRARNGFVVAGKRNMGGQSQPEGGRNRCRQTGTKGTQRFHAMRMNNIGQEYDKGVRCGVDPKRGARKPRMTVGADGEQFATVAGVRRLNVPAKPPKYRLVGGTSWLGEFLHRKWVENSLSFKFTIRKHHKNEFRQVIPSSKKPSMPGHPAPLPGPGVGKPHPEM